MGISRFEGSRLVRRLMVALAICGCIGCSAYGQNGQDAGDKAGASSEEQAGSGEEEMAKADAKENLELATLGGGCFWCVEAVFEQMKGVKDVVSGYAGGHVENPSYKQVCTGQSGHAEVCEIYYDPEIVTYDEILEVFFKTHDPTTLNRQGNDVGPQYRSVIFYHSDEQKKLAEKYIAKLDEVGAYASKIVTEVSAAPKFYRAEEYHQDYYRNNPNQGYCAFVVRPKVEKFKEVFPGKLAEDEAK